MTFTERHLDETVRIRLSLDTGEIRVVSLLVKALQVRA